MKKNAVLYPFCGEVLAAVKIFEKLQEEYELKYLVAPSGFGLTGMDAGYVYNHPKVGKTVLGDIPFEDREWDTLLLFEPILQQGKFFLRESMEKAILWKKNVVVLCACRVCMSEEIKKIAQNHPEQVVIKDCPIIVEEKGDSHIHEPEVPVLLVGGLLKEADCSEVLLNLTEQFRKDGKRIVVFSEYPVGSLFGFFSLGHIWNSKEDSEDEKIRKINLYVNFIARRSSASLILLEAPDALMRYNEAAPNGFGIRSYMLCQAVSPDYLVGCIPFDLADASLIEMLGEDFFYRLGCGFHAVHVSNMLLDPGDSLKRQNVEGIHVELCFVWQQLKKSRGKSKIPMFDVITEGIEGLYERIRDDA